MLGACGEVILPNSCRCSSGKTSGPQRTRSTSDRSGRCWLLAGWRFCSAEQKQRIGNDQRDSQGGNRCWLPGVAEPELLAADHDYRATGLLGSVLGRAVRLLGAGCQIGKLKLQGRQVGRLFGRCCVGVDHRRGSSVLADSRVNRPEGTDGLGLGLVAVKVSHPPLFLAIAGCSAKLRARERRTQHPP